MNRRQLTTATLGLLLLRPAAATPDTMREAIRAYTGDVPLRDGRVVLDIAPLVENGNAVPTTVRVDSPMTATDHVRSIALFSEQNPNADVVVFHLGPRAGRAEVATRIRLATSQQLVAVATMSDGSCWQHRVDVLVTLAACVEGG